MKQEPSPTPPQPPRPRGARTAATRGRDGAAAPASVVEPSEDDPKSTTRTTSGIAPANPSGPVRNGRIFKSLEAGVLVGDKYRLVRCLGEGGMATLWVAHNEALDIEVVIKFIRADLTTPRLAERLLHEARAAAKLGHPAIVRVFDFGRTGRGDPYIVMELLDGEDLSSVYLDSGRMTPVVALRTLLPIAHALAVAHDKGIVHRDLKPENVFLARAEDGQIQPKLLDFGVAKQNVQGYERLTQAGTAVGSPAYMSPEQARGEEVGPQSDVWSFSVVLYEALSGVLPFHDENYNALMRQIIEREPTPLTDLAAGDAELWDIIARGLTKDLERRWDSMRAIGSALAHWLVDRGITEDLAGASLAATWHHSRQSWVDSDGMFERVLADSGLREVVAPPRGRDDHPSKVETIAPPSRDAETPAAGTPTPSLSSSLRVRPTTPAPSKRSFALLRNLGIALVGAVVAIAAVSYFLSGGSSQQPPAPVADPPAPKVRPQGVAPAKEDPRPAQVAPVVQPTERPAPTADPDLRPLPTPAPSPAAAVATSPAPDATRPAPTAARAGGNPKASPQPAPKKPQPKGGELEIKTTF